MSDNNAGRIDRGQAALDFYMDNHLDHREDMLRSPEALTDLLTDLRHACAEDGLDFDAAVRTSQMHFEEEV